MSASERPLDAGRVREVTLRDDEHVGRGDLPLRLLAAEAVLRVDRRDHRLEGVLVAHERLGDERRDDRRRVRDSGGLDDDAA